MYKLPEKCPLCQQPAEWVRRENSSLTKYKKFMHIGCIYNVLFDEYCCLNHSNGMITKYIWFKYLGYECKCRFLHSKENYNIVKYVFFAEIFDISHYDPNESFEVGFEKFKQMLRLRNFI